ncbi:carbonate dehydratase [Pseudidiomarina tainanensis]|uniref:Carbonate dehydratase n=1 Tax=Pseudidiomarina tainanensis TaxID=502365 RepID=A0ACD2HHG1_9GAMM|nr:HAD-IC family P-type ATPase [Pseudidiomarina tainanensis]RZQ56048.1 carbonate dehydratase [Pseudidiomarina tainanensis]
MQTQWHAMSSADVLQHTQSNQQGLTSDEAQRRRQQQGPNTLPTIKPEPAWLRLARQFHNVLIYVLIGATGVTLLLQHYVDAGVIFAVIIINAIIGYYQEGKAESAIAGLRHMLAPTALVVRDGKQYHIPAEQLVVGDIVILEAGARVPADLRLLETHSLQVQEALLTGESAAVNKQIDLLAEQTPLGSRACMAYLGTWVTTGHAQGVVTATGSNTEFGHIGVMLSEVSRLTTPLVEQTARFSKWLTFLILISAGILLAYASWLELKPFAELFMIMVSIAVAAIPEGLPAVMTITLAVGVQAMAKRHAIVRHLPSIETLGAVSVICTDKTGTLTRNEMMVAALTTAGAQLTVSGDGYAPDGAVIDTATPASNRLSSDMNDAGRIAMLCNDAQLHQAEDGWQVVGDPMEGALLAFAAKLGWSLDHDRRQWHRHDEIPFDAESRYMATLNHDHRGNAFIHVKGAPEQVLSMCSHQLVGNQSEHLVHEYWLNQAQQLAAQGLRVLALAQRPVTDSKVVLEQADVNEGLILVGLVGLIDPPRNETIAAIQQCQQAGIGVKMITGDHPGTAAAIARQVGIENAENVLTGTDLDQLSDHEFHEAMQHTHVFARTSPAHKLRLVQALQAQQHIVAMTGDGVNDAPALKRADVGIVMGIRGSEATKQAADVVLTDDNFASIVAAISQGRTVYDNLKKVISWDIPTSVGESMAIIIALLLGLALPITPVQLLWVNLVTAITLGLTLAFEPTEPNSMCRPPRHRSEPLLRGALVWHVVFVSVLFVSALYGAFQYALNQGQSIEVARSMALNTAVVLEIFHLFFIRNIYGPSFTWRALRGTRALWLAIILVLLAQALVTYLPAAQKLLGIAALNWQQVGLVMCLGVALLLIVELEKQIRTRVFNWRL